MTNREIQTKVFDNETNTLYTLHLIEGAEGLFVGKIKEEKIFSRISYE